MTSLLDAAVYGQRDDGALLAELNALTRHHRAGCEPYARLAGHADAERLEDVPFVHVGVFKHVDLRTEAEGIAHQRTLLSSATTSGTSSRIALDAKSSQLQAQSVVRILGDFMGEGQRPLLVIDSARALRRRGEMSARIAAAMSLRPMASEIKFLLADSDDPSSLDWETVAKAAQDHDELLVYGFTWILWQAWGAPEMPPHVAEALSGKRIHFVHSGGWKKLESAKIAPERVSAALLQDLDPESQVIDFYGLVEQVGIIYPLCEAGYRHVPAWADVMVRDPHTLEPLDDTTGCLQLLNILAYGAPYHSVLTEDLGRLVPGACECQRPSKRFELLGRIPRAETRGCANV